MQDENVRQSTVGGASTSGQVDRDQQQTASEITITAESPRVIEALERIEAKIDASKSEHKPSYFPRGYF